MDYTSTSDTVYASTTTASTALIHSIYFDASDRESDDELYFTITAASTTHWYTAMTAGLNNARAPVPTIRIESVWTCCVHTSTLTLSFMN